MNEYGFVPFFFLICFPKWIPESLTDEGLPRTRVLTLSPAVRPAHHHRVVLHAAQAAGLDQMDDALPHFGRHHNLAETFNSLDLHHIFYGLEEIRRAN